MSEEPKERMDWRSIGGLLVIAREAAAFGPKLRAIHDAAVEELEDHISASAEGIAKIRKEKEAKIAKAKAEADAKAKARADAEARANRVKPKIAEPQPEPEPETVEPRTVV